MNRDPESVAFEATYWQELLHDLQATSDLVGKIAQDLTDVAVGNAETAIALVFATPLIGLATTGDGRTPVLEQAEQAIEKVGEALKASMGHLGELQEKLGTIGDLAGGRAEAIMREAGIGDEPE